MATILTYGEATGSEGSPVHRHDSDELLALVIVFDQGGPIRCPNVALNDHLAKGTSFSDFFAQANLNPAAAEISGTICGVKIQEIQDPLMKQIRYLDKLVDELFQGRPMAKVLRS